MTNMKITEAQVGDTIEGCFPGYEHPLTITVETPYRHGILEARTASGYVCYYTCGENDTVTLVEEAES